MPFPNNVVEIMSVSYNKDLLKKVHSGFKGIIEDILIYDPEKRIGIDSIYKKLILLDFND